MNDQEIRELIERFEREQRDAGRPLAENPPQPQFQPPNPRPERNVPQQAERQNPVEEPPRRRVEPDDVDWDNDSASSSAPTSSAAGGAIGALLQFLAWAILAAVGGAIVYMVVRAIMTMERGAKPEAAKVLAGSTLAPSADKPDHAPGELPADVYVARAHELAKSGKYQEAVAQLLLGAMSHSERAGWVKYRRGMTLRDYLWALSGKLSQPHMRALVKVYEPLAFGRREALPEHFETCLSEYEAGFGEKKRASRA